MVPHSAHAGYSPLVLVSLFIQSGVIQIICEGSRYNDSSFAAFDNKTYRSIDPWCHSVSNHNHSFVVNIQDKPKHTSLTSCWRRVRGNREKTSSEHEAN